MNSIETKLADLAHRFTHHPPVGDQATRYEAIRTEGLALAKRLLDLCPDGPELQAAIGFVDQAVMHANAAIARRDQQPTTEPAPAPAPAAPAAPEATDAPAA